MKSIKPVVKKLLKRCIPTLKAGEHNGQQPLKMGQPLTHLPPSSSHTPLFKSHQSRLVCLYQGYLRRNLRDSSSSTTNQLICPSSLTWLYPSRGLSLLWQLSFPPRFQTSANVPKDTPLKGLRGHWRSSYWGTRPRRSARWMLLLSRKTSSSSDSSPE